ncbi:DUF6879 family protein [Nocardia sp. GCM10030253]|uniref:DUF6879 family protein n=1 Tax=Nocardia sp. GCM10030253 TaxID=3273404 RepID=UPI00362DE3D3
MLYLPVGTAGKLLGMAQRRAFHLEVEDDHALSNEDEPMRRWRAGLPPLDPQNYPPDWKRWEDLTDAATARGVALQRVRATFCRVRGHSRSRRDRSRCHGPGRVVVQSYPAHRLRARERALERV